LDGCSTQATASGGAITVTSNCQYHYPEMIYSSAAKYTARSPCTNVPIPCPYC
ncbi:hypothetical protein CPC08DRAFT_603449, partial [Agrocybe pediades]